jgi:hypothetical protein
MLPMPQVPSDNFKIWLDGFFTALFQLGTLYSLVTFPFLQADNMTMSTKYSFSMYRSVAHMLGMGYGQHLPPTTLVELWLGITSYILGGTFYALFIAHVSNLIISRNLAGRNYEEKVTPLSLQTSDTHSAEATFQVCQTHLFPGSFSHPYRSRIP